MTDRAETAEQTYNQLRTDIFHQINEVIEMLGDHRKDFDADKTNWGMVGDLQHYSALLAQIINS